MNLIQQTMQLSRMRDGVEKKINKLVVLWERVGLCYHKSAYAMNGKGYIISHYKSGKSILKGIKTPDSARVYMQRLAEIQANWNFSEEEWNQVDPETKTVFKAAVDEMQKEIWEGQAQ